MSKFAPTRFQTLFADALLDARRPPPPGIIAHQAEVPTRRFAVHRNNVVSGLADALRSRFPVTEKIVGEDFFAAMTRAFVLERPPRSPLLANYGDELAGFIAAFKPAREIAYLADVAQLEAARSRAYHAADAVPIDAGRFAALDARTVGDVIVELLPSTEIVRSPHPIVTIWAMNSGEQKLAPIENWSGEDALAVRPYLDVEIRTLPPGGAAFLLALADGRPIGEAAGAGFADHAKFDLSRNLAGLIGSRLARNVIPKPTRRTLV
jgi:Putative DNA-binding domain